METQAGGLIRSMAAGPAPLLRNGDRKQPTVARHPLSDPTNEGPPSGLNAPSPADPVLPHSTSPAWA